MKGQTASSSYKPAKLSNGARVMVPPPHQPGDAHRPAARGRQLRRAREGVKDGLVRGPRRPDAYPVNLDMIGAAYGTTGENSRASARAAAKAGRALSDFEVAPEGLVPGKLSRGTDRPCGDRAPIAAKDARECAPVRASCPSRSSRTRSSEDNPRAPARRRWRREAFLRIGVREERDHRGALDHHLAAGRRPTGSRARERNGWG